MREQQTLGRRIQEARKAAGLSQESLGERLGVSRQAVSKWEADAAVPEPARQSRRLQRRSDGCALRARRSGQLHAHT